MKKILYWIHKQNYVDQIKTTRNNNTGYLNTDTWKNLKNIFNYNQLQHPMNNNVNKLLKKLQNKSGSNFAVILINT